MSEFEGFAGTPTPDGPAREASEAEPSHDDGRLSTVYEESEADLESHVMEVWYAELREERELLEATPPEDLRHTHAHCSISKCADHSSW
eukprot:8574977-Pyramimonas_sp.AAC.1